jgi:hypothetical protein
MSFWVILNNLNPCLNYNFHFKGIKMNVLNNAIDFNFLSWISNAYIYVWQCSYTAFDWIIYDIRNLKDIKFILKGQQGKWLFFFSHLVEFLYSLALKFMAPSVNKMCKKFHARKHVKLYIKAYVFIFCIFVFLPKYLCIIRHVCEKSPPLWKLL